MRDHVSQFFELGETLAFEARLDCSAAAFRLVDGLIGAEVAIEFSTAAMLHRLDARPRAGVDDPTLSPDAVMIEAANSARHHGMAMRRAALEARACMDDRLSAEFARLLNAPGAVFAYDRDKGSVMLIDNTNRVLVVARGST